MDALETDKPILSAPMAGAAGPELVAAVCNAGGYGVIPLWGNSVDQVSAGIDELRALTDRNFAVNLNLSFPYKDQLEACIDKGVHGVSLFWGMEPSAIARAKAAGLVVLVSVGCADEARIAADAGADVIVAQGWEAGGHVWGQVSTMALVPAVVDAVEIPVVAAGGIADGRGMAAALMLGASGVWIGTRFLASSEATIHSDYRARILQASEADTQWSHDLYDVGWPAAPHRALSNSTSKAWADAGCSAPGNRPNEKELIGQRPNGDPVERYQSYTPLPQTVGDVEAMSLWSGQGVSLVREIMPAADIVEEIYLDAKKSLQAGDVLS
ncbi:NAD(P)H-dependent flavin oxidoreductase [Sulfitobacter geojensis]|uniref:Nitronate monooxygenase n=1 Tax=Sulfitobacter geojensis TaxID=1342299 RepID=A0AAE2W1P7_9RHOB|nr:nitronate monooxygenase [Sulfitobacter geojensis]MBM1691156.1 nitronate monooxygenase [Sulfitobacter geojensis]MBM1695222.1 nitronate monooxygenase [Sulfitobacter geojensis]MBM1707322.1 nitronate monooxygenase [Sulfitobacter geojensis]MBM1711472.1 nitronate monooxygenase [Sulfitobacter geojensis]MBM1715447.1 nitronate monooxygenase [Sulfitobacter geojensis]